MNMVTRATTANGIELPVAKNLRDPTWWELNGRGLVACLAIGVVSLLALAAIYFATH